MDSKYLECWEYLCACFLIDPYVPRWGKAWLRVGAQ